MLIAKDSVPYAIQTTIKPENIKVTLLITEPTLLTPISLMNKYINIPDNNGCKRTKMLQASTNGSRKNKRLKGVRTADWKLAR